LKGQVEVKEQPNTISLESVKTNPNKPDTYNNPTQNGGEKLDLSFLLNILDGVLEIPGRIVIMTSNYIDKLDHALIRPGRIDIIANFKRCVNKTLIEMIEFFYDISLSEKDKIRILNLREFVVSPAEMGKVMFENFDNFRNAIERLEKICEEKEKEEEEKEEEEKEKEEIYTPFIETPVENPVENPIENITKEEVRTNPLNILGEENMKKMDEIRKDKELIEMAKSMFDKSTSETEEQYLERIIKNPTFVRLSYAEEEQRKNREKQQQQDLLIRSPDKPYGVNDSIESFNASTFTLSVY
jgi:hypothetical protein